MELEIKPAELIEYLCRKIQDNKHVTELTKKKETFAPTELLYALEANISASFNISPLALEGPELCTVRCILVLLNNVYRYEPTFMFFGNSKKIENLAKVATCSRIAVLLSKNIYKTIAERETFARILDEYDQTCFLSNEAEYLYKGLKEPTVEYQDEDDVDVYLEGEEAVKNIEENLRVIGHNYWKVDIVLNADGNTLYKISDIERS